MKRLNIRVLGKVQNVWFRGSAKEIADELALAGWAMNDPDGSVRIEVEGDSTSVERFCAWCESGPADARVEDIECIEIPIQGDLDFRIIT